MVSWLAVGDGVPPDGAGANGRRGHLKVTPELCWNSVFGSPSYLPSKAFVGGMGLTQFSNVVVGGLGVGLVHRIQGETYQPSQ